MPKIRREPKEEKSGSASHTSLQCSNPKDVTPRRKFLTM
jgi:hypothetical protein